MATRRLKKATVPTTKDVSLRANKIDSLTKTIDVSNEEINSLGNKRTRSTSELGQELEQKLRAVFGDITNKNNKPTKTAVKDLKKSKLPVPIKRANDIIKMTRTAKLATSHSPVVVQPIQEELLIVELTNALQPMDLTKEKPKTPPVENLETIPMNLIIGDGLQVEIKEAKVEDSETAIDYDAFDREHVGQPFWEANYAKEIFCYYKERESTFAIPDYMRSKENYITTDMRTILIDWLVGVQTNMELHQETLYLAVKLVDMYLSKVRSRHSVLQLVGTAALFIACKYDECVLPQCEDYLYVCDHAYTLEKLFEMEKKILIAVGFRLGIPLSYRFLRRYCKVAGLLPKTMILARYILELSLLDYNFVCEKESLKAAGCLWLALKMENLEWNAMLTHHSGCNESKAKEMGRKFNEMLLTPPSVNEVENKYSHQFFMAIAQIPKLSMAQLDNTYAEKCTY